jgi:Fe2+ transport system protein FeoA
MLQLSLKYGMLLESSGDHPKPMTALFHNLGSRTVHLPTEPANPSPACRPVRKGLRLSDLHEGETARVLRLAFPDVGCRKRFAELGLAEGMKVTVTGTGDTLMLIIGGARMGLAARCADEIIVARVAS